MDYFKKFEEIIEGLKEDPSLAAILLIGKTARVEEDDFNHLNDVDLLAVYEVNRVFERQVELIDGVPFDISYISIFDLITQVEDRSNIWVSIMMGAKIYYAKNELIFGIIDRVKDIYLNGTTLMKTEDIDFIRFTLTQKVKDIENRMKDVVLSGYLMQRLFNQVLEDYYTLNALWPPHPKNAFENLEVINADLCKLAKDFVYECTAKRQLLIIKEIVESVLEPFGGPLSEWKKGHYRIDK